MPASQALLSGLSTIENLSRPLLYAARLVCRATVKKDLLATLFLALCIMMGFGCILLNRKRKSHTLFNRMFKPPYFDKENTVKDAGKKKTVMRDLKMG